MTNTLDDIVPQEDADALAKRLQDKGPLHRTLTALDGMKGKNYTFSVNYDFLKNGESEGAPPRILALVAMVKGVRKPEAEVLVISVDMAGSYKLAAEGRSAIMDTTPESANDATGLINEWLKGLRRTHDLRQFQATWTRSQDAAESSMAAAADKIRAAKPDTRLGKPV